MHLRLLERVEIFPIPLIGRRHVASFSLFNQSSFLIHTAQLGIQSLTFFIPEHNLSVLGIVLWCLSMCNQIFNYPTLETRTSLPYNPFSKLGAYFLPSVFPVALDLSIFRKRTATVRPITRRRFTGAVQVVSSLSNNYRPLLQHRATCGSKKGPARPPVPSCRFSAPRSAPAHLQTIRSPSLTLRSIDKAASVYRLERAVLDFRSPDDSNLLYCCFQFPLFFGASEKGAVCSWMQQYAVS